MKTPLNRGTIEARRKVIAANAVGMTGAVLLGWLAEVKVIQPSNGVWMLVALTLIWGGYVITTAANHR